MDPRQLLRRDVEVDSSYVCLNLKARNDQTLTIRDEVYKKLVSVKDPDESFSDLLTRLVEGGSSVDSLRRLRGSVIFTDKQKMIKEISVFRSETRD